MKLKRVLTYLIIAVILVASFFVFFNPVWLQPFPSMKMYEGELSFSGTNAMEKLKELTEGYKGRQFGSGTDKASAKWISGEFKKLGLKTEINEFQYIDRGSIQNQLEKVEGDTGLSSIRGFNVTGISKGKSDDIILIGAHRDVAGNIQGVEDNGTGTASMLELVRVLCGQDHYYTYLFASFDGEEFGRKGSIDFFEKNKRLPIKFAYLMDMTGYSSATTVGYYCYMSPKGAVPLWALALGCNILEQDNKTPLYYEVMATPSKSAWELFSKITYYKFYGHVNTDSSPFIDGGVPAIGVMAAGDKNDSSSGAFGLRTIHSEKDTIATVSKDTLEMTGRFSEKYIRSIELNQTGWILLNGNYIISDGKVLSPVLIIGFFSLVYLIGIVLIFMILLEKRIKINKFLHFLKNEISWIIWPIACATSSILILQLLRINYFNRFSSLQKGVLFVLLTGIAGLLLFLLRRKSLKIKNINSLEWSDMQIVLLNILLLLISIGMLWPLNAFQTLYIMGLLLILPGLLNNRSKPGRIVGLVLTGITLAVQLSMVYKLLNTYLLEFSSPKAMEALFLLILMWIYILLYIACNPPLPGAKLTGDKKETMQKM